MAFGVTIPRNARIIRNLMHGAQFQHDHLVHFYHLHALDWVDIVSALSADPQKTAALADNVSNDKMGGSAYYKQVQQRLQTFVDSGQLGPFANAYWGHPAYKLPPEANLMACAHYIEALQLQARAARMHAIFGGKNPHPQGLVVGGVTCVADLTPDRIAEFLYITKETQEFIKNVYIPDLLAVASFYKDWGAIGGTTNFLAWGELPLSEKEPESLYMPRGVIMKRDLANVKMADPAKVTEDVTRAWYEKGSPKHPFEGETKPLKEDPKYDPDKGKYSWFKAPRYEGEPCEVGPLARVLVAYGKGHKDIKPIVDTCSKPWTCRPRRSSPPWAAPLRAVSRPSLLEMRWKPGSWNWSGTLRAAILKPISRTRSRTRARATDSMTLPAAPWATGSKSKTRRSRITSMWYPRPGTSARAMPRASWDRWKRL
jgi:[NiFe] hydrogenase large subunit